MARYRTPDYKSFWLRILKVLLHCFQLPLLLYLFVSCLYVVCYYCVEACEIFSLSLVWNVTVLCLFVWGMQWALLIWKLICFSSALFSPFSLSGMPVFGLGHFSYLISPTSYFPLLLGKFPQLYFLFLF